MEACFGITPDISPLLTFTFYQRVYFLDTEIPFPDSKERVGRFIGIAENVGDLMTFWIWTEDTEKIIARSVIRSAEDPETQNHRASRAIDQSKDVSAKSVVGMKDLLLNVTLPVVDPDKLVGGAFLTEHAGVAQKMEVKSKEEGKYHF